MPAGRGGVLLGQIPFCVVGGVGGKRPQFARLVGCFEV